MCGRFTLTADLRAIQQHFHLQSLPEDIPPRYNIAPSQPIAVIANDDPTRLTFFRWGLVPSWSKDLAIGNKMINARAETLAEKPSFRSAFKRRRCLIPADGFYEWTGDGKNRKPMFLHLADRSVFAFAGLWEVWHGPDGEEVRSCTIITGEPNELVQPLHHRMAVILHEEDYDTWLQPGDMDAKELMPLLRPYESERMAVYEVSKAVNSPSNDTPECIAPIAEPPAQGSLL
ncbi:MAG: SOS response-associated peptidase [Anaerolineae bacterium]